MKAIRQLPDRTLKQLGGYITGTIPA